MGGGGGRMTPHGAGLDCEAAERADQFPSCPRARPRSPGDTKTIHRYSLERRRSTRRLSIVDEKSPFTSFVSPPSPPSPMCAASGSLLFVRARSGLRGQEARGHTPQETGARPVAEEKPHGSADYLQGGVLMRVLVPVWLF